MPKKDKPDIVNSQETEKDIPVTTVPTINIDDNPFNNRRFYPEDSIKEMAESIELFGLRQVPTGRRKDGRVQLAFGHIRFRAFKYLDVHFKGAKEKNPWTVFPLILKDLSDAEMFDYAMEENLRRTNVLPIEVARAIEAYTNLFPDVKDKDIAKRHNMTEANVSNMRRVLRLPEKFLQMVDEGKLSFTQGRELLTLESLPDALELMTEAVEGLTIEGNQFNLFKGALADTVGGLQKSIHIVMVGRYHNVSETTAPFDPTTAGCFKCEKCIITHPDKKLTSRFCPDVQCWNQKAEEFKLAGIKKEPQKPVENTPPENKEKPDISQEKPAETKAQNKEKPAPEEKPSPSGEKNKPEQKATNTEGEPGLVVKKLRQIFIEEKEKTVVVSINTGKSDVLFQEEFAGSLEDAAARMPALLAKAMKGM